LTIGLASACVGRHTLEPDVALEFCNKLRSETSVDCPRESAINERQILELLRSAFPVGLREAFYFQKDVDQVMADYLIECIDLDEMEDGTYLYVCYYDIDPETPYHLIGEYYEGGWLRYLSDDS
jgi:hypothetical protein